MFNIKLLILLHGLLALGISTPISKNNELKCELPQSIIDEIAGYANVTNSILDYFIKGPFKGETWKRVADFVDRFGHRMTGTKTLEDSIDYMIDMASRENLDGIYTHNVQVPYWNRGKESVTLLTPRLKSLPVLGLGLSVGTGPDGITANAVVVQSFDELKALSEDQVVGKIVVYNQPYIEYPQAAQYRLMGADEAAKVGAVAALVRSITDFSIATPHTGVVLYSGNVTKIPVAAITPEDAEFLWRQYRRGEELNKNFKMGATVEDKISRNFRVDLKGTNMKEKLIVVSGHIDSWDVGDGSMDDAGGSFLSYLVPVALKNLNLTPRRTIRTILFTAEELAIVGAEAYERDHRDENQNLTFVMECDFGTFAPLGLNYDGSEEGKCMMAEILKLFGSINATELGDKDSGPDISVWTRQGIPGVGLHNANDKYFWFHHTNGDTLNVLDSDTLDMAAGFWTAVTYIVANLENDIPRL